MKIDDSQDSHSGIKSTQVLGSRMQETAGSDLGQEMLHQPFLGARKTFATTRIGGMARREVVGIGWLCRKQSPCDRCDRPCAFLRH